MAGKTFIPVTEEELHRWERIIQSGLRGTHLLFTNEMIRDAFERPGTERMLSEKVVQDQLQNTLATLARSQHFQEKQQVIENLDAETRAVLVHLYFGLLEQLERRRGGRAETLH